MHYVMHTARNVIIDLALRPVCPYPASHARQGHGHKDIEQTAKAIRAGDRVALARAITLVESAKPEDQASAQKLLDVLLPHTGSAIRVGVSGVPGPASPR